jgi:hypothetical protein
MLTHYSVTLKAELRCLELLMLILQFQTGRFCWPVPGQPWGATYHTDLTNVVLDLRSFYWKLCEFPAGPGVCAGLHCSANTQLTVCNDVSPLTPCLSFNPPGLVQKKRTCMEGKLTFCAIRITSQFGFGAALPSVTWLCLSIRTATPGMA